MTPRPRLLVAALLLASALAGPPGRALAPDQLVLIVNKNVPEGVALAKYYAQKRAVPDGRIVELDLPTGEDLPFAAYETQVFPVVRTFLAQHKLADKVTCAVTFYGVPIRVQGRVATPADVAERAGIAADLARVSADAAADVAHVEALARRSDPTFAPAAGGSLDQLAARADAAAAVVFKHLAAVQDPEAREALATVIGRAIDPLVGKAVLAERQMLQLGNNPKATPAEVAAAQKLHDDLARLHAQFDDFQSRRADPAARQAARQLAKDALGPFDYARTLTGIAGYLDATDTQAATDSELALLWWNFAPRPRWVPNALNFKARGLGPPVLMTARLDGPTPDVARRIIDDAIAVEQVGLAGKVVVDSGGHLALDPNNPAYRAYDDTLRHLADLLRAKTPLGPDLVFDEKREVLPAGSVKGVALYCGWYAVRNYTPACAFVRGAVAFHIGSYEMVSLRNPGESGWCRGLLNDGVAATLGPESEPYLSAFPPADEFFPLLMTGKLTLAETYWKTTTMTSWRISLIGDPLYSPYKLHPLLTPADLPEPLRAALQHK